MITKVSAGWDTEVLRASAQRAFGLLRRGCPGELHGLRDIHHRWPGETPVGGRGEIPVEGQGLIFNVIRRSLRLVNRERERHTQARRDTEIGRQEIAWLREVDKQLRPREFRPTKKEPWPSAWDPNLHACASFYLREIASSAVRAIRTATPVTGSHVMGFNTLTPIDWTPWNSTQNQGLTLSFHTLTADEVQRLYRTMWEK